MIRKIIGMNIIRILRKHLEVSPRDQNSHKIVLSHTDGPRWRPGTAGRTVSQETRDSGGLRGWVIVGDVLVALFRENLKARLRSAGVP